MQTNNIFETYLEAYKAVLMPNAYMYPTRIVRTADRKYQVVRA